MKLNDKNYHSQKANIEYLSASQYKDFAGTLGQKGCEARAMAKLKGEWVEEPTTAMMVGSYVDAYFEGSIVRFRSEHPEIFRKDGELRAEYAKAEEIIKRIARDPYLMKCLSGKKQRIFTASLYGARWKCKVDSYIEGVAIVDLKVMSSLRKSLWVKDHGNVSFVEYWGYDIQGAIYQAIIEAQTGKRTPFLIAAASKEEVTDIEAIAFTDNQLNDALSLIERNVARILMLKAVEVPPDRCGTCDYCKETKVLSGPIHSSDLIIR